MRSGDISARPELEPHAGSRVLDPEHEPLNDAEAEAVIGVETEKGDVRVAADDQVDGVPPTDTSTPCPSGIAAVP